MWLQSTLNVCHSKLGCFFVTHAGPNGKFPFKNSIQKKYNGGPAVIINITTIWKCSSVILRECTRKLWRAQKDSELSAVMPYERTLKGHTTMHLEWLTALGTTCGPKITKQQCCFDCINFLVYSSLAPIWWNTMSLAQRVFLSWWLSRSWAFNLHSVPHPA